MVSKCLAETCKSAPAAQCRGLCMKCYSTAKKLVEKGDTTWERLEEIGLAEAKETPFTAHFNKHKGK